MYQEFFAGKGVLLLPILAMFLFAVTFCAVAVQALRRGKSEEYKELASLPLACDGQEGASHE